MSHYVQGLMLKSFSNKTLLLLVLNNFISAIILFNIIKYVFSYGFNLKVILSLMLVVVISGALNNRLMSLYGPSTSILKSMKNFSNIELKVETLKPLIIYKLHVEDKIFYVESYLVIHEVKDNLGNSFKLEPVFKTNKYYSVGLPKIKSFNVTYNLGVYYRMPIQSIENKIKLDGLLAERYFLSYGLEKFIN